MLMPINEFRYVKRIYALLFAMILINPLLSNIITITTVLRSMELLSFIGIFYYEYKLYKGRCLRNLSGYEKSLFILLFVISIGIIFRGQWPTSPNGFFLHILTTTTYLLPFIILKLPNEKYFKELLNLFFKISLWVIPLWIMNYSDLIQVGTYKAEGIGSYLPFISAFLLGLSAYFTKRQRNINIVIWATFFMLMMMNARRNVSFSLLLYAVIAYVLISLSSLKKNTAKTIIIYLFSILTGLILLLNFDSLTSGVFNNMANRAHEDTRSGVEELFFMDFSNAPVSDWVFGRGMDGSYYQSMRNEETGEIIDYRNGIETGYLNMMLKGGIIYDVVIILIMILAIKRGFKKRDIVCRYISIILFTYFIDLYTTNPVCTFSVRSILFWFIVSILLNKSKDKKRIRYSYI